MRECRVADLFRLQICVSLRMILSKISGLTHPGLFNPWPEHRNSGVHSCIYHPFLHPHPKFRAGYHWGCLCSRLRLGNSSRIQWYFANVGPRSLSCWAWVPRSLSCWAPRSLSCWARQWFFCPYMLNMQVISLIDCIHVLQIKGTSLCLKPLFLDLMPEVIWLLFWHGCATASPYHLRYQIAENKYCQVDKQV